MADITLKPLARGVGTGSLVDIYTVPVSFRAMLLSFVVTNQTGGAVTLIVKVLQDPTLDGGTYRFAIPPRSVNNNSTDLCPELIRQTLNAGGKIQLQGNGLEFLGSGAEILMT